MAQPGRRVWCIDGDGALLVHMGSLVSTHALRLGNLVHVMLNNSCHESVGGQPTAATLDNGAGSDRGICGVDFAELARAAGYAHVLRATTLAELHGLQLKGVSAHEGSTFVELITCVDMETNKQLCRPNEALATLKDSTCVYLQGM